MVEWEVTTVAVQGLVGLSHILWSYLIFLVR